MEPNYWNRMLTSRVGRRRTLAAGGAGLLGAAFLAACGDDSEEPSASTSTATGAASTTGTSTGGSGASSSLVAEPRDTSAEAKTGGVMQSFLRADLVGLDPTTVPSLTTLNYLVNVYSNLTKFGLATDHVPGPEAIAGDAAESWEFSPDGTQVTFHLRPDHVFDPRPPTNGRAMTSDDVKFSWDRFSSLSRYGPETLNSADPTGPVLSLENPDPQTVIIKMAFPYTPIVELLGFHSYLFLLPVEADGGFDPEAEVRGSGPFFMTRWEPSSRVELEANKSWYEDGPYLDGMINTILPDYAAGLAQFESKAIWDYTVEQQDILRVKQDHPEMVLLATSARNGTPLDHYFQFSQQPESPYRDVRVRQAVSMLIDRDGWLNAMYDSDTFASQGLPVEGLWHSHIPVQGPNWLDPKGSDLGDGAKYFQHNPEEAVKLIDAAGIDQVSSTFLWTALAGPYGKRSELVLGMLTESGKFDLAASALDHNTEWRETCQRSGGLGFDGVCYATSGGYNEESYLVSVYTPNGKYRISSEPVPKFTDWASNIRTELDNDARAQMVKDIQKELALEMPMIPMPGIASTFTLRWPWLLNHGVFSSGSESSREEAYYWYDSSKQS